MARGTTTQNLFLQITGSSSGMQQAVKAGRASLAELGTAAGDLQKVVAENFRKMGGSELVANAHQMETNWRNSLTRMRDASLAMTKTPITPTSLLSNFSGGGEDALAQAQANAAGFRELSNIQAQMLAMKPALTAGERELAVALELSALKAEQEAQALDEQLAPLRALRAQLGITADAQDEVAGAHSRAGASSMILGHIVRSTADSFAAGLPPTMIFAEQMGRVTEALQFAAMESGRTEGAIGKLAGFLGGGWGIALQVAISGAAALARSMMDGKSAAEENAKGHDELKEALDRLAGASAAANHETRQGIIDDINAASAARQHAAAEREKLAAKLASAKADVQNVAKDQYQPGMEGSGAAGVVAEKFVADIDKQMADNASKIQGLNKDILAGSAKLISRDAAGAADPRTGANQRYDDAKDALQRRYEKGGIKSDDFRAQMATLDAQHADELDNLKRRQKKPRADHSVERAANTDRAYQGQVDQAQEGYARALAAISGTTQQRTQVEIQSLRDRLTQRLAEIDDMQAAKKIPGQTAQEVQANADRLRILARDTEVLEEQAARRKEMSDLLNQQFSVVKAQMGSDANLLDLRQQTAVGRKDQYSLAQQSLAKRQQANYADILHRLDPANDDVSPDDRAQAYVDYQALPATEAQQKANLAKQYQSPLDQYRDQLKSNVGDMGSALQNIGVDEFKGMEDGFVGIVSGAEKASKAVKGMVTSMVADFARLAFEKTAVSILGGSFFGLSGGGKVAGFALGGIPGYAGGVTPSRAGNRIRGAGNGTSDSILARLTNGKIIRVANGEGIMTEKAVNDYWPMLDAMNKGSFKGFADGGLPVPRSMPDLSSADMAQLSSSRQRLDISVRGEEGPYFRPVIHGIAGQHARVAQDNATDNGARLAAEKTAWARGRQLGGAR